MAAGVVTWTSRWVPGTEVKKCVATVVCEGNGDGEVAGAVPDSASDSVNGYITRVAFIPGDVAPDADFDVHLYDEDGCLLSGTNLEALAGTATTSWIPSETIFVSGPITMTVADQSTASAEFEIVIYVEAC